MKCPTCGCKKFYVKDTDDEYEVYTFTAQEGTVSFDPDLDPESLPEVTAKSESFCDRCAWHGKIESLG